MCGCESGHSTRILDIELKIRCSTLCVLQEGPNFKHILELTFKQQIFIILIGEYFLQHRFLKI